MSDPAPDHSHRLLRLVRSKGLLDETTARELQEAIDSGAEARDLLIERGILTAYLADNLERELAHQGEQLLIGHYHVKNMIGRGGMATVYRAVHLTQQIEVALKVLNPQFAKDKRNVSRFQREALAVGAIRHPNIVSCLDVGEIDGRIFMALELVEGGDVDKLCQRRGGRLPVDEVVAIAIDCCHGLCAVHEREIIHRDIKPSNIFIDRGGIAKLADFGLVRSSFTEDGLTIDGMTLGTPAFMSPEQASGNSRVDIRTDIYSLGASLYRMSTGRPPYHADTPWAIVAQVVQDPTPDPREVIGDMPDEFADVIMRAMAKDRDQRYYTPQEFVADLQRLKQQLAGAPPRQRGRATVDGFEETQGQAVPFDPEAPTQGVALDRETRPTYRVGKPAGDAPSAGSRIIWIVVVISAILAVAAILTFSGLIP